MSRWVNTFQSHGFNNVLRDFVSKIEETTFSKDADENAATEFGRIRKVVTYINDIMSSVDPELISPHALNEMQGQLQNALNEFNTYVSNKNFAHLQNSNNSLDHVLNVVSRAFVYYSKPSKSKLKNILKSYSDILDEHRDNYQNAATEQVNQLSSSAGEEIEQVKSSTGDIQNHLNKIGDQINKVQEEVTALEQQAQNQLAEFNTQFQNSQSVNQTKSDDLIENMNVKLVGQQEKNQAKSDNLIENMNVKFVGQQEKNQTKFDDLLKKTEDKINNEFAALATKAGTIVDMLRKLQEDAESVFGIVQNTTQAGAHKKYAKEERGIANRYRYGAISLMLFAVAILVTPEVLKFSSIEQTLSEFIININWDNLLKRLPISVILFAPAFYLARESNKHRQNEFQNRRRELTLRTIDPYLALIQDNVKSEELKCQIARDIFGESKTTIEQSSDTSDVLAQLSNLVNTLLKR